MMFLIMGLKEPLQWDLQCNFPKIESFQSWVRERFIIENGFFNGCSQQLKCNPRKGCLCS